MGFFPKLVWVIMGLGPLGHETPANQLGGPKILWVFVGYGLSQVWVKTGRLDPLARKILSAMVGFIWVKFKLFFVGC